MRSWETFLARYNQLRTVTWAAAMLPLLGSLVVASEWPPQWRGPGCDGSVPGIAPDPWPARLSLLWERNVGEG